MSDGAKSSNLHIFLQFCGVIVWCFYVCYNLVDDTITYVGALMATGDVIAQTVIDKKSFNAIEWTRVGRFAFIGATLIVSTYLCTYVPNVSSVYRKFFLLHCSGEIFSCYVAYWYIFRFFTVKFFFSYKKFFKVLTN